MDDFFDIDDVNVEQSDEQREARGRKRKTQGTLAIFLGLGLLAGAAGLSAYNVIDDQAAGKAAEEELLRLEEAIGMDANGDGYIGRVPIAEYDGDGNGIPDIEEGNLPNSIGPGRTAFDSSSLTDGGTAFELAVNESVGVKTGETEAESLMAEEARMVEVPIYELYPMMTMPTYEIDGNEYIGYLVIPSIGRFLPVMSSWSYPNLRIAPSRYNGTAYQHNLVICAHNYDRHFGLIKNLKMGDEVRFVDAYGDRFTYKVDAVIQLEPYDSRQMKENTDWDLTLFTCTLGGQHRVTCRCSLVSSYAARTVRRKAQVETEEESESETEIKKEDAAKTDTSQGIIDDPEAKPSSGIIFEAGGSN